MIIWNPSFETGFDDIDSQHKRLIDLLNDFEAAIDRGMGSSKLLELINQLDEYAKVHFAHEESCMNKNNCPAAQANQSAHKSFVGMIADAKLKVNRPAANAPLAMKIHGQLVEWISAHILRIDTALRSCRFAI